MGDRSIGGARPGARTAVVIQCRAKNRSRSASGEIRELREQMKSVRAVVS